MYVWCSCPSLYHSLLSLHPPPLPVCVVFLRVGPCEQQQRMDWVQLFPSERSPTCEKMSVGGCACPGKCPLSLFSPSLLASYLPLISLLSKNDIQHVKVLWKLSRDSVALSEMVCDGIWWWCSRAFSLTLPKSALWTEKASTAHTMELYRRKSQLLCNRSVTLFGFLTHAVLWNGTLNIKSWHTFWLVSLAKWPVISHVATSPRDCFFLNHLNVIVLINVITMSFLKQL